MKHIYLYRINILLVFFYNSVFASIFSATFLFTSDVLSQEISQKPARVFELERTLVKEIEEIIQNFIPNHPFTVVVKIDPIYRNRSSGAVDTKNKESLPFYETENDEIHDEWDDPNKSDFDLLKRVQRINIKVTTSSEINDVQIIDLRTYILSRIPLVDGRDNVDIIKRDWAVSDPQGDRQKYAGYTVWILSIGLVLLLVFVVLYFLVNSWSIGRVTSAIRNIKVSGGGGGQGETIIPDSLGLSPRGPGYPGLPISSPEGSPLGAGQGQIQFNDSLKMTETVLSLISHVAETSHVFPSLEDMLVLDAYVQKYPHSVGALLKEFPSALSKRIFSLSYKEAWLKAFSEPGNIDMQSFELMRKLVKHDRENLTPEWEDLLIDCWRLDKQLPSFLKFIPSRDALSILSHLPRSISIRVARETLPGEWAVVLRTSGKESILSPEVCKKHSEEALRILPLRPTDSLDTYRIEMDITKYLQTCDISVEKEIYGALPKNSMLPSSRPPFYSIFEAESGVLKEFSSKVSLEEWALALMNIPKDQRMKVEVYFSERQKFSFIEYLKRFDRMGLSPEVIGEARGRLGRTFAEFKDLKRQENERFSRSKTNGHQQTKDKTEINGVSEGGEDAPQAKAA